MRKELGNLSSKQEAVGKTKNGKASGESGILPEMMKAIHGDSEIMEMLLITWEECRVLADWIDICSCSATTGCCG